MLAGVWSRVAIEGRLVTLLGQATSRSQKRLVADILRHVGNRHPPSTSALSKIVIDASGFDRIATVATRGDVPVRMVLKPPRFAPVGTDITADIPRLATSGEIARWLGIPIEQLEWFADERRQHGRTVIPDLLHYTYAFRKKQLGPPRLIEAPKPRLKTIQRKILREILDHVPAHDAAHGFVAGRSCRAGAEVHTAAAMVVSFDLADFFLSTPLGRVHALFRSLGYPYEAARVLTRLCSTVTPGAMLDRVPKPARHTRAALMAYQAPHLPQGAPTSPALANLVAWRLDVRLAGLAKAFAARYTRYADDLSFSGDEAFAQKASSLAAAVEPIANDEGYLLNPRKTRFMSAARRQQVTGIVVNTNTNVGRDSYDRLKAILHNCRRHGLENENRDEHRDFRAHLEGRVGWVESLNPARGKRLRAILDEIA